MIHIHYEILAGRHPELKEKPELKIFVLTPCSRFLIEKLIVAQLSRNSTHFKQSENVLPCL
jgi:hypothetical protein